MARLKGYLIHYRVFSILCFATRPLSVGLTSDDVGPALGGRVGVRSDDMLVLGREYSQGNVIVMFVYLCKNIVPPVCFIQYYKPFWGRWKPRICGHGRLNVSINVILFYSKQGAISQKTQQIWKKRPSQRSKIINMMWFELFVFLCLFKLFIMASSLPIHVVALICTYTPYPG